MNMERPGVGVGVCVRKDGKVLLGKRINCVGVGMWAFPGGHVEMYEDPMETVIRETAEETSLKIQNPTFACFVNTFQKDIGEHYVTLVYIADAADEPKNMEPHKCEKWEWFPLGELPDPLFWATRKFIESGYNPFKS